MKRAIVVLDPRQQGGTMAGLAGDRAQHPPSVYVLPNRPSFVNGRTDACEYAWFVWGLTATPEIRVLATTPKSERCGR